MMSATANFHLRTAYKLKNSTHNKLQFLRFNLHSILALDALETDYLQHF